jgi:recombination protein RecR
LTFYLLHVPKAEVEKFSSALTGLGVGITLCRICKNVSENEVCDIDSDNSRDQTTICVVETPLDVFSLEKTGNYKGLYHVLHGLINPIQNIGPDELYIFDLSERVDKGKIDEVILALNPTMEGEATAMYLSRQLKLKHPLLKVTRLGVGIPIGGDLQYADETTLTRAMQGRRTVD